jgi:hypothetical protein
MTLSHRPETGGPGDPEIAEIIAEWRAFMDHWFGWLPACIRAKGVSHDASN